MHFRLAETTHKKNNDSNASFPFVKELRLVLNNILSISNNPFIATVLVPIFFVVVVVDKMNSYKVFLDNVVDVKEYCVQTALEDWLDGFGPIVIPEAVAGRENRKPWSRQSGQVQ